VYVLAALCVIKRWW